METNSNHADSNSILIVAPFTSFLEEKNREGRHPYLCSIFQNSFSLKTCLITSLFSHNLKSNRKIRHKRSFEIIYAYEPGYRRNSSFQRLFSNAILQLSVIYCFSLRYFLSPVPKVIICTYPFEWLCLFFAFYGRIVGAYVVIDLQDLWPSAMLTEVRAGIRPFVSPLLCFSWLAGQIAFFLADKVSTVSIKYSKFALLARSICVLYLGGDFVSSFSAKNREIRGSSAKQILDDLNSGSKSLIRLLFAGSITGSYDLSSLIQYVINYNSINDHNASTLLLDIAGSGPDLNSISSRFKYSKFVCFHGQIEYSDLSLLMVNAHAMVNPISLFAFQDINNRLCDYILTGKPIISTRLCNEITEKFSITQLIYWDSTSFSSCIDSLMTSSCQNIETNNPFIKKAFYRASSYLSFAKEILRSSSLQC